MGEHGAVGAPLAQEVDLQHALDLLGIHGGQCTLDVNAGVGDGHVKAPEAAHRAGYGTLKRRGVGDVGLKAGAAIAELRGQSLQALCLQPDQGHVGTAAVQGLGGLGSDPSSGAGDENGATPYLIASPGVEVALGPGARGGVRSVHLAQAAIGVGARVTGRSSCS